VCGFAGIASPRSQRIVSREEVDVMLTTIAYRGPDDAATTFRPHFAVGFRRLAIVDPQFGRQPMSTDDAALDVVHNGEIYNHEELRETLASRGHRFRTRCDSEVLLYAYREWGEGCAKHLRGIFAFAIWDESRQALFLCRDRSGVKPLFLRVHGEELLFASEAKALLAHPSASRRIDLLGCFAQAEPDALLEESPFQGISQLGAGCSLTFTAAGELRPLRYWTYEPVLELGADDDGGDQDIARFREELLRVVPMQLMADVPLGAYLSGGLDSSVVAAAARTHVAGLPTFTSVSAGSEDPWFAYVLSRASDLRNTHFVRFSPEDLLEELPRVAWGAEGTFDLGFLGRYQLATAASRLGLKVLLSGQGADELMGGYEGSYSALARSARQAAHAARLLDSGWSAVAGALSDSIDCEPADLAIHLKREHAALSHYLLRFEDRMGMLAGVEVRVPFLDHRLVEICASIGGARRRSLFGDKRLLREAARGLVPDGVRMRAKFAFNGHLPPISQLLLSVDRETDVSELLTESTIKDRSYFDPRQVRRLTEACNYRALDAVLIVHLLDELFVSNFDPARFASPRVSAPQIRVDASWMPAATVLFLARQGPSSADVPWLNSAVTHVGLIHAVQASRSEQPLVLAIQLNDGRRTFMPVPEDLEATKVVEFLRATDGTRTYSQIAASLGVTVETALAIGRMASDQGLLEHGPKALPGSESLS
jgi:asparagine synthase (glutamine-hydrolysing)